MCSAISAVGETVKFRGSSLTGSCVYMMAMCIIKYERIFETMNRILKGKMPFHTNSIGLRVTGHFLWENVKIHHNYKIWK